MLFLLIPLLLFVIIYLSYKENVKSIKNKHVVVTGGSSGIGKSLAQLAVQMGAHVTIIARNKEKLEIAHREICQYKIDESQKISMVSTDVSHLRITTYELEKIEEEIGPIYMLVNCAGMAICGKLESLSGEDITAQVFTNFLGTVYPIKAVVSKFKQRKEGIIVLTASQGALLGIFGMSVYAGTKFALRGFAEALDMEVRPYNVTVTVALPPDTDTPGFEKENIAKPLETAMICESGGLYNPDVVAKGIMSDALKGNFFSYIGFESFLMCTLCVGMSPFSSIFEVLYQSVLIGPIRLISACFLKRFHYIVKKLSK